MPLNAAQSLRDQVHQKALELGFDKVGIATVSPEPNVAETQHVAALQTWLQQGHQAHMDWMNNPKRQDIRNVMPNVRSVICVVLNYYTAHQRPEGDNYAKVARYAWGRDYHKVMHKRLKALGSWLESLDPDIQTRYYADTGPIQDKFWAEQAGLGWIAKNSNLITREYGSWVFLGEILTNLDLPPERAHTQHCGTCQRCIEACPTGAITQPYVVDANRCIAYHTIENRAATLPAEITPHLQNWVAGCDICQDVCPWNHRFAQPTNIPELQPSASHLNSTLKDLATLSREDYDRRFQASALRRIKLEMWHRNANACLNEVEDG
jgi:epoxyqueuosine reductase